MRCAEKIDVTTVWESSSHGILISGKPNRKMKSIKIHLRNEVHELSPSSST